MRSIAPLSNFVSPWAFLISPFHQIFAQQKFRALDSGDWNNREFQCGPLQIFAQQKFRALEHSTLEQWRMRNQCGPFFYFPFSSLRSKNLEHSSSRMAIDGKITAKCGLLKFLPGKNLEHWSSGQWNIGHA
jgi:hypothetical protein